MKNSELQQLSQKENYALFVLKSIKSQLVHLNKLSGYIIWINEIKNCCDVMEQKIKTEQMHRKEKYK